MRMEAEFFLILIFQSFLFSFVTSNILIPNLDEHDPLDFIFDIQSDSFVDHFNQFDNSIWDVDTKLHCTTVEQGKERCILRTTDNVKVVHYLDKKDNHTIESELKLSLRNDCNHQDEKCCDEASGRCATLTSGQITSRGMYSYGTFRFLARPSGTCDNYEPENWCYKQKNRKITNCEYWSKKGECKTNPHWMHSCCKKECGVCTGVHRERSLYDSWTCYGLESRAFSYAAPNLMAINMCIPSISPMNVILLWQYGGRFETTRFKLPFNAAKRTSLFRIDWHPDRIEWHVNGAPLATLKASTHKIPNRPMYIKAVIVPRASIESVDDSIRSNQTLEIHSRIMRIRYRAFPNVTDMVVPPKVPFPNHNELFSNVDVSLTLKMILVAGTILLSLFVVLIFHFMGNRRCSNGGYYVSLDEYEFTPHKP